MKFFVRYRINPPGHFGIPDGNEVIVPSALKTIFTPTVDNHDPNMSFVGYGTLPIYRKDDEAINLEFNLSGTSFTIKDNFFRLGVEAIDLNEAYYKANNILEEFLKNLGLSSGILFTYEAFQFEAENGEFHNLPRYIEFPTARVYNLVKLKQDFYEAAKYHNLEDARLSKAIDYLEQAQLLFLRIGNITSPFSRHYSQLFASIYLNLWKSITVVIGDSRERDFQSRYKKLGFDFNYFKNNIEPIKRMRDDFDVAHYSLKQENIQEVRKQFGIAQRTVSEVLRRYRDKLLENKK